MRPIEEWQAKLKADPELAEYLKLAFRRFDATGDWPDVREMQRDLVRDGKELDVISAGNRIPVELGITPMRMRDLATLTIIGVSLCEGSEDLRKSFIQLLQMCIDAYKQPGEPRVSGDAIQSSLGVPPDVVRKLAKLADFEPFVQIASESEGKYSLLVNDNVRHFTKVSSLNDYVEAKGRLMPKPGLGAGAESRVLAIVRTDLVGSTTLRQELGEDNWRSKRDAHYVSTRRLLTEYNGVELNELGDGILAWFMKPSEALAFAQAFQKAVVESKLKAYVAIDAGECSMNPSGSPDGIVLHRVERLLKVTGSGEVLVSLGLVTLVDGLGYTFYPKTVALKDFNVDRAYLLQLSPTHDVPRTAKQIDAVLLNRPTAWEYLLFAGYLVVGKNELERKWRDHELGYRIPHGPPISDTDAGTILHSALSDTQTYVSNATRLLEKEPQVRAFGSPGVPGDAEAIEHLAKRLVNVYEDLLDWEARVRGGRVSTRFERAFALAANLVNKPIRQFREFFDTFADEMDQVGSKIAAGGPVELNLTLLISIDDTALGEFNNEIDALKRSYGLS